MHNLKIRYALFNTTFHAWIPTYRVDPQNISSIVRFMHYHYMHCDHISCISCLLMHQFPLPNMQNGIKKRGHHRGTHNKKEHKAGGARLQAKVRWKKHPKLWDGFGQVFNESNPLSYAQTHEQFGIMCIPDVLWIKCNFYGQLVHDPRTTSEDITRIYPVKLHLASLRGKRTSIYEYFTAAQRTKFAVASRHTTQEFKLFNTSESLHGD